VQYQIGSGGSTVEKPAKNQTSISLDSHLVREPNSRSGGHDFESPMRCDLGALTKSGKTQDSWVHVFIQDKISAFKVL
jgi:hypothetical protein